ncbi:MAG: MotA/TolQ/ExbB proton channel family protein [Dissulfuribacterales bacterium]
MRDMFLRGGPIMWPLLLCSMVSLTISIERIVFWWKEKRRRDRNRLGKILRQTEAGDYRGVLQDRNERKIEIDGLDFLARIIISGLANRDYGLRESMEVAAEDEIEGMKRGMDILDTIITMAPLLGILGTVLGIIDSFNLLGHGGIEDPKAVTGGIAQALITTAAGLTVALMTLIPFNYLVAKVKKETKQINKIIVRFEAAYRNGLEKNDHDT